METDGEHRYCIPGRAAGIDLLVIAGLWCLSLAIVNPSGEFPLNDDWAYGLTAKQLVETGEFRPTGWGAMTLITHVAWGSLFCLPGGFSFEALRLSTLAISLIGIMAAYLLMRELRQSRWSAVVVALTVAFNPIYYALSNTFMTDVPFTAMTILASVFLVRSLKWDSTFDLLMGALLTVAATLNRQAGIATPLAFAICLVLKNGLTGRNVIRALLPSALCLGALSAFQLWTAATGRLPVHHSARSERVLEAFADPGVFWGFVKSAYIPLPYLGWFLLPVLVFTLGSNWAYLKGKMGTRIAMLTAALVLGGLTLALWHKGDLMPIRGNIIVPAGIGPLTLRDTCVAGTTHMPGLSTHFWLAMTAASLLGGAMVVIGMGVAAVSLFQKPWSGKLAPNQAMTAFVLLSAAIYMVPIFLVHFLDRYLVPLVPLIAASIASSTSHTPKQSGAMGARLLPIVSSVLIGQLAVFAICGTRDYLAWNRARWVALSELTHVERVEPKDIDGGFEFNGQHLYNPQYVAKPGRSGWWVEGDEYVIAFCSISGYSVARTYPYRQWMPPRDSAVVVLEKDHANDMDAPIVED